MSMTIEAACGCNMGKVRKNNEDNFYFGGRMLPLDNNGLRTVYSQKFKADATPMFAVFDGMGGEEAGEVASFVAAEIADAYVQRLQRFLVPPRDLLEEMCAEMNRAVCRESAKLEFGRMGSTVAALLFFGDQPYVCNLGDSRIYRLRDNELLQLSQDHLEMVPPGVNRKARLMQHLGIFEDEMQLEPYIAKGTAEAGDIFLLCSDGLTDMLTPVEICTILKENRSVKRATDKLIKLALEHGGKDNITVILCKIK